MPDTERKFTWGDVRLISMFARLEGAPSTVQEIVRDLDEKGELSGSPVISAPKETEA